MIPRPGPHGGDGLAVARALHLDPAELVDLSMSLNPFAPDIVALAGGQLGALRYYPDAGDATAALADAMGVDRARLLLTNGGSEAISLVARSLGGTVSTEPEFALHPRGSGPPLWRSNPNNPSGLLAGPGERADVWDEAFFALAAGRWTRADPGVVVVGSLTKVFACPGLRLGYVLADDAARFAATQPGWPLNSLALAVLPQLLAAADLPAWSRSIAGRRDELAGLLRRHGLQPHPCDAPWLLTAAPGLRERLAPFGIVIRDCASFGLPQHVRIAVPDDRGLDRLSSALSTIADGADS